FDRIIALFTIGKVAADRGMRELVLVGAPVEITAGLKQNFRVRSVSPRSDRIALGCMWAVASRVGFVLKSACECWRARNYQPPEKSEIVFSGFWNWSVDIDEKTDTIVDRYFCDVPNIIQSESNLSVTWLAWLDHPRLPQHQKSIFILQCELRVRDLLKSLFDFKPLVGLMRVWSKSEFRHAF